MRIFKPLLLLGIALVSFNNTLLANSFRSTNPIMEEEVQIVQREVVQLLRNKSLSISEEKVFNVLVAVNSRNQIVVLDVGTSDEKIDQFVRRSLHNRKVPRLSRRGWAPFICPVKLTPHS